MSEKITVRCTSCSATLAVPDSAAGKKIRCPKCKAVVSVLQSQLPTPDQCKPYFPDPVESGQPRWHTDDQFGPEASMNEYGETDWGTDRATQAPPTLPPTSNYEDERSRRAPIQNTKVVRRALPAVPSSVKGPSKPGTGNSAKGRVESVVTTEDEQGNSIAPKVCIAVVGVAVLFSICLIYRSKTEQLKQRAADLWEQAQKRLDEKQIEDATRLLTQYSSAWQATERQKAQELLQQIQHVTSDSEVLKSLVELSESDFAVAESIHAINDGRISHPALLETRAVSIERNLAEAMRLRSEVVLRRERELAEAEARAEEDRQKQERAREEAERRAENDRIAVVGQSADTTRLLGLNKQEREQVRKEIASIEASLASADVTSRTVFQQQVARIDACIEATGLLARALGASADDVAQITRKLSTSDLLSDTVYQQIVGHLTIYVNVMELAAKKSGASKEECEKIQSELRLKNIGARNVQQQIVLGIDAVAGMANLLAESLGVSSADLSSITSSVNLNDATADTVFQQMVARQTGLVRILGAAARTEGAEEQRAGRLEDEFSRDDLRADGVQQQLALRLQKGFEMTALLVNAIVAK